MVYLYSKLAKGCMWKDKQMTATCMLLTVIYLHPLLFMHHFHNACATPFLIIHMYHFHAWIVQHFPRIYGWSYVDTYVEDMHHACAFNLLIVNQMIELFRVYLECMVADDTHFQAYVDHCQTRPLDNIDLYTVGFWVMFDVSTFA